MAARTNLSPTAMMFTSTVRSAKCCRIVSTYSSSACATAGGGNRNQNSSSCCHGWAHTMSSMYLFLTVIESAFSFEDAST